MTSELTKLSLVCALLISLSACNGGGGTSTGTIINNPYRPYNVMFDPYYSLYLLDTQNSYLAFWMSPDGYIYDVMTGMPINSADGTHSHDAITNAAAAQKAATTRFSSALQAKYGLTADVSNHAATVMNDWVVLGKSRKRTDADIAAFTQRLSGLDMGDITAAMNAVDQGDLSAVDQAVTKAAANWSTSPDTMKQILSDWMTAQNAAEAAGN